MQILSNIISIMLTAVVLLVTYSIVLVSGIILAIGGAINWPLLKMLGWLHGRQKV